MAGILSPAKKPKPDPAPAIGIKPVVGGRGGPALPSVPRPAPDAVVGNAGQGGQFGIPLAAATQLATRTPPPDQVVGNAAQGGQFPAPAGAAADKTVPPLKDPGTDKAGRDSIIDADYSSDPVLADIRNSEQDTLNQTNSSLDDQMRQLLIGTGLRGVAESQLGKDSPFLAAITDDPNGVSKASRLNRSYKDSTRASDEDFGDRGVGFSGARVGALSNLAHSHLVDESDLAAQLMQALGGINDSRIGARSAYNRNITAAESAARDRAIQLALKYGLGNPGGGAGADAAEPSGGADGSPLDLGAVLGIPPDTGPANPLTSAFTQTTSGQTSFTPEQLATIAALPVNQAAAPAKKKQTALGNYLAKLA